VVFGETFFLSPESTTFPPNATSLLQAKTSRLESVIATNSLPTCSHLKNGRGIITRCQYRGGNNKQPTSSLVSLAFNIPQRMYFPLHHPLSPFTDTLPVTALMNPKRKASSSASETPKKSYNKNVFSPRDSLSAYILHPENYDTHA
jgi:hypothetical protein